MPILSALGGLPSQTVADLASDIEDIFLATLNDDSSGELYLRAATLARYTYYFAAAIAEKGRAGTTQHLRPSWKAFVENYKDFVASHSNLRLCNAITEDDVTQLARHANIRQGSRKDNFYFSLLLFLISHRNGEEFKSSFFRAVCPTGERNFLNDAIREIERLAAGKTPGVDLNNNAQADYGTLRFNFEYDRQKMESFRRYMDEYAAGDPIGLHFVIYRPRKRIPSQLVKSFLSIQSHTEEYDGQTHNVLKFVHIYSPPSDAGSRQRISLGRVLPLADGLYFVGGQKAMIQQRVPFSSLKVLCFPWRGIEHQDRVLHGLTMSANYKGMPIVSRISARVTPISHSKDLRLGAVDCTRLVDSIEEDLLVEMDVPSTNERFAGSNEREVASQIIRQCNNNPAAESGWRLAEDYKPIKGQKRGASELSTHGVIAELEQAFGSERRPKFKGPDGTNFDFWASLRFGPLSND